MTPSSRPACASKVKVLIGGAPITQKYADEIGADGYSENAVGAVALAKKAVPLRPVDATSHRGRLGRGQTL